MAICKSSWILRAAGILLALASSATAQFTPAPSPTFPSPYPFPFPAGNPSSIVAGNFNGDSILDLAVADRLGGTVTLILSNGAGGFTAGGPYGVGALPSSMALIGIDTNNNQELAVVNQGDNTVTVLLINVSNGTAITLSPVKVGSSPTSVAVGIFLTGGNLDLAVANRDSNNVTLLRNDGTGKLTPYSSGPFLVGNGPSSVAAGDFNGDGNMDLAVTNEMDNTVTVLLGDGNGGFKQAATSPFAVGSNPDFVVTKDFNGDGNLDLAIANLTSDNVTVLLGNGAGVFTAAAGGPFAVGSKPVSMVVGDFNEDLIPDLAVANFGSNTVTVLVGNGTGGFKAGLGSPVTVGNNPSSVAVGDFNGDGAPDLAVANSKDDNVSVLLNTITPTPVVMVSNASYSATAPVALGSIVSIFGTNLSSLLPLAAASTPAPTCLDSIVVTLTDAAGLKNPLPLLYVGPTQIDALIPQVAATGAASFTVSPSALCTGSPSSAAQTSLSQKGSVTLAAVAPGLFTANETGKGVALGYVYDLASGLPVNYVYMCTPPPPTNPTMPPTCTPLSINVNQGSPALVLYGTGIRNRPNLSSVTVTIGGQTLPAFYAGAASVNPALDQVNVSLPPSLAGSGTVLVTVSVSGTTSSPAMTSNAVAVNIQ